MRKYGILKKVFNWSEVHLSETTCYKIHTLVEMLDLECQSQMEASSTACYSFYVLCENVFLLLGKSFLKLFATKLPLEMMHMTFILIKTLLFDL